MAIGKRWQGDKTAKTRESLQKLKSRKGVSPEGPFRPPIEPCQKWVNSSSFFDIIAA